VNFTIKRLGITFAGPIDFLCMIEGGRTMLRMIAVVILTTGMSVGLAQAKGAKGPACQTEQQATVNCACGPKKTMCKKGDWCHAFSGTCTK
jgi:hypothetical protein